MGNNRRDYNESLIGRHGHGHRDEEERTVRRDIFAKNTIEEQTFFNNNSRVVGLGRLRKKLSRSACRKQYIICQPCDGEGVGDIRPKSSNVILQNFSSLQRKGLKRKLDAGAAAKKGGGRD
jgi:hypothetical protein